MPPRDGIDEIAFPEAIVGIVINPDLPIPVVEQGRAVRITAATDFAVYMMFHWPWSKSGDVDSHTLFSFN